MKSRAAILYEYGRPWSVEEFELDPPRAGEVLVRLAATGLCHSDEHIRQGKPAPPPDASGSPGMPAMSPTIGGHEGSGVVVEVGEGVTRFEPGDHVVTSFVAICGQCRWCESAPRFGATHTAATAPEAIDLVRQLTRGVMADAVIVSPAMIGEADVGMALALTRKGGTCVLTGLPSRATNSIAVTLQDFILMNKTLCGTVFGFCNPKSEIPLLATLYESGRLLLDEMITKRYGLEDINDAYQDQAEGKLIRGVIDFGIA